MKQSCELSFSAFGGKPHVSYPFKSDANSMARTINGQRIKILGGFFHSGLNSRDAYYIRRTFAVACHKF